MNSKWFKDTYRKYLNRGREASMSSTDIKKVRLFNFFCLLWFGLVILMLIEDLYLHGTILLVNIGTCGFMTLFLVCINMLHYNKKHKLSYLMYILGIIVLTFYFSNFIYKGQLLEYYFILAPAVAVIFLDDNRVNNIILIISFLLMQIPNLYLSHYPDLMFNDMSVVFIFLGINYLIRFFKRLNSENEHLLKQINEELKTVNNLKSQFFTNVTHEIRTPLTLLNGAIDALDTKDITSQHISKIKQKSTEQIEKIARIVDDVIDLSRLDADSFELQKQSVDLSALLHRIYANFQSAFDRKGIKFTSDIPNRRNLGCIDTMYIERALYNLLSNALKYTSSGGNVHLSLSVENGNAIMRVQDDGIGILPEDIERISERFYQVDNDINKTGGSGIGLNYVQEIIKKHNARLHIESTIEEGSVFSIFLPIDTSCTEVVELQDMEIKAMVGNMSSQKVTPVNVLIVEDNLDMQEYLCSILSDNHCTVTNHGQEALEVLKTEKIDIILSDYMMPTMNGIELIEHIRAKGMDIPFIMLTAKSDKESRVDALKKGANDYIHKPFDRHELTIRMKNLLHFHQSKLSYNESQEEDAPVVEPSIIDNIEAYIQKHVSRQDMKQEDICTEFSLSKSSLYRKIKSSTGLSPNAFIKEIRLQRARQIVENNPQILLKQLTKEVGFSHQTHFSKIYLERFGSKPWTV